MFGYCQHQWFTWWYRQATKSPDSDVFVTVKSTVSLPDDEQHPASRRAGGVLTAERSEPLSTSVALLAVDAAGGGLVAELVAIGATYALATVCRLLSLRNSSRGARLR